MNEPPARPELSADRPELTKLRQRSDALMEKLTKGPAEKVAAGPPAAAVPPVAAPRASRHHATRLSRALSQKTARRLTVTVLALLAVAVASSALFPDRSAWLAGTLAGAGLLNCLVYGVGKATDRLGWYAFAVFSSVVVLGGAVELAHTAESPKVQPVAVIRKGDDIAVCGVYVAETDKRLYIGSLASKGSTGPTGANTPANLFWIPESDIDVVNVGPLESLKNALTAEPLLATELYANRAEEHRPNIPSTMTVTNGSPDSSAAATGATQTTTTTETPAEEQHPLLKASPPYNQRCATVGGPQLSPRYDP